MGKPFWLSWFGKSVAELKEILETEPLTAEQKADLQKLIDEKEKAEKSE